MSTRRRANERQGEAAGKIIAAEVNGEHVPGESYWYDVVTPNGTKIEVKSTHTELDDGSEGRFRLWEDQHTSLTSAEASGTAWYAFVLFSTDDEVVGIQRRKPSTVTRIVREIALEDGEPWSVAKHREREARQKKVPWSEVMSI
ncbi:hypothetical protein [Halobellus limi]|uniref:DUF3883 domain-containing protein n=1 Tax=Halobellus limi TaxID=699433 RepID=A0A1H5T188_9EURY|nr:hypothetical protein [Halobellus limi]QCC47433.1 hypothetical protein DV707_07030 [Halobellus limi]SEF56593.1 hypothetical protein SAMN04488133_0142 [Halobellus limi]